MRKVGEKQETEKTKRQRVDSSVENTPEKAMKQCPNTQNQQDTLENTQKTDQTKLFPIDQLVSSGRLPGPLQHRSLPIPRMALRPGETIELTKKFPTINMETFATKQGIRIVQILDWSIVPDILGTTLLLVKKTAFALRPNTPKVTK